MTNRAKRRARATEQAWDDLTRLLVSRYEDAGMGMHPRLVRDFIDRGREESQRLGEPLVEWGSRYAVSGRPASADSITVQHLLTAAWPVNAYQRLAALAAQAKEYGRYIGQTTPNVQQALMSLCHIAEEAAGRGTPWTHVIGWIEVLVQMAEHEQADDLWTTLIGGRPVRRLSQTGRGSAPSIDPLKWNAAFGPLGTLAWAAGLSFEEARTQQEASTLKVDVLVGLAALCGYRITPVTEI